MCQIGRFWVLTALERTFYIGDMDNQHRRCTAVNKNGNVCQAWSMWGTKPPRCSAHAGRNVGAGAPLGNSNARKHGLYSSKMTAEEIGSLESYAEDKSLQGELVLARLQLIRMIGYQMQEDVPVEQKAKMGAMIISGIRAVAFVMAQMSKTESAVDWDAILDELGEELDWDI